MAKQATSGQVLVEMAVLSLMLVGLFFVAISISQTAAKQQTQYQFKSPRGAR